MPLERIYDGKGLDAHKLALVEPFCISLHGVSRADIHPGEKVLVVGAGTIGVFAAKAAMLKGGEVTICDVSENKLEIAKSLGITNTLLNDDPETFMNKVNEITDHNGFDVTIEAVGLPSTFQNCLDAVCFHGRVVLIGVSKRNIDLFFTIIQKKELAVYGSRNALKEDFLYTIEKLASGELDIDKAVTSVFKLEDAAAAFAEFDAHQGENLKVLIDFE
jgi:2-desacetyl-2-hydroxyethyl bacteriochlorophyllide A dehydrogenase